MRAHRCGTLSGMDAAPEPTRTYLRRVPRWYAPQAPAANRSSRMKVPDVVRKIDRSTELVDGAAPHPVSGHAVNPSLAARWRRPCRHTVPPPDAAPCFQHCHC
ncbi:hypothetical protein xavtCFBP7764_06980 [Xanthomonas citri]|nr:hypothetical protein xavtCFBP7764_06980 [Xanthomonas citri]